MSVSMVLYSFAIILYARSDDDPCLSTNHLILTDEWRSTSYVKGPSTPSHCDVAILPAWYRVASEKLGEIATSFPSLDSCGTSFPIWMDDGLVSSDVRDTILGLVTDVKNCITQLFCPRTLFPSAGTITNVTMCLRTAFSSCHSSWNIEVKDCLSFFVYHLVHPSICASAYCFDPPNTSTSGSSPITTDPAITTSTSTTLGDTGKVTSGSNSFNKDTHKDSPTASSLVGPLVAVLLSIVIALIILLLCCKLKANKRQVVQVDPDHDYPKEAVLKVMGFPS